MMDPSARNACLFEFRELIFTYIFGALNHIYLSIAIIIELYYGETRHNQVKALVRGEDITFQANERSE